MATERAKASTNIDPLTVQGFGEEWRAFDQSALSAEEHRRHFDAYFRIFPWESLPGDPEGFDLGCGSGRWALQVAPRVGRLHCIDPAEEALGVARRRLQYHKHVDFILAAADTNPLPDASQDFGYSLGVLHHVPDTARALTDGVRKLKPGAPFLVYLYYAFDQRPGWFKLLWRASDKLRRRIASLPFGPKKLATDLIAGCVYWPLARLSGVAEAAGADVGNWPLSTYRAASFYTMRTDAIDRFGTRLEQRFSRDQIARMMSDAGLERITFSDEPPFWVAVGYRSPA